MNHPHVVSSPIARDTVLVKVQNSHGEVVRERVGKLLLEISVRKLHQDLMKPAPTGLSEAYCKSSNKLLISERYLRNILPPQLRAMTFAQNQMCGCEICTIMKMHHTSLSMFRKKQSLKNTNNFSIATRSRTVTGHDIQSYMTDILTDNNHVFPTACSVLEEMFCRHTSHIKNGLV